MSVHYSEVIHEVLKSICIHLIIKINFAVIIKTPAGHPLYEVGFEIWVLNEELSSRTQNRLQLH